ncbi:3'(2'),5'-bisphosphate nucleotidase CysQ [Brevundimonas sp. 2R-24]|uniref:3'(2'),5'-bisphosphate nucleotidase CysQ n=1 Tax=Peiella sedimenti TaxID=3061083 RepID=A0ABT8SH82_9CAUL|nr:3'(2'),5'-bisphosphate nucleotidase CysQ [Caulobacteraceae bacterium XZ-24]
MSHTEQDIALARRLAEGAGRLLVELRSRGDLEGKALGQAADAAADAWLMAAIAAACPTDGLLCEETRDNPIRLGRSRVWIIDPLDGTREYGEGRDDWAVHVALTVDGRPVVGVVALPDQGVVWTNADGAAASQTGRPLRMLVSRTRPAPEAMAVAEALGAELVPMGSAGAKAMAVLQGKADIYLHSGGQYEWDSCAPAAVAIAHGFHASRADGAELVYNQADPWMPDLLVCRPELADRVLALRDELRAATGADTGANTGAHG